MDKTVLDAMARWPDVPAVYGWLSLSERGLWRLHPAGDALARPDSQGEEISSPPILQFIGRNYSADAKGQWFFQNGPQRVYVRLDAAPFILHTAANADGGLVLHTHNGLAAGQVTLWLLTDDGRLYAKTEQGPGLIQGRDLEGVLDRLQTADGDPVLELLGQEDLPTDGISVASRLATEGSAAPETSPVAVLRRCHIADVEAQLGFVRMPSSESA